MSNKRLWLAGFLFAGSSAFSADDPWQIAQASVAKWNEAFATGKVDDIVSLYSDHAMMVQPNGSVSKSSGEIRAFWQTLIDNKGGTFAFDIVEVRSEKEDTIITTTKFTDVKTLNTQRQVMKYNYDGLLYSVLKRQSDGSWKAEAQRWSDKSRS